MKKEKHNGLVSLWKFIFCVVIAIYHGQLLYGNEPVPLFRGGYIAVELFFLISGYFFAKSALKEKYNGESIGKDTISFVWKRMKKLIPYIIVIYIIWLIFLIFYSKPPLTISQIVNSIWNPLLVRTFGFRAPFMVTAVWYLTVLFTCMLILYPILKKYRDNFILLASPIIALFFLGYLNHHYYGLDISYAAWGEYICAAFIRGFAELNIGFIIYYLNKKLEKVEYTKFAKVFLTITPWIILIIVLGITSFIPRHKEYDYIMLLLFTIALQIMVSGKTYDLKYFSNKFIFFLESISMIIFINHQFFRQVVLDHPFFENISLNKCLIIYVSATIVFSIIEYLIISRIQKLDLKRIRRFIIKE